MIKHHCLLICMMFVFFSCSHPKNNKIEGKNKKNSDLISRQVFDTLNNQVFRFDTLSNHDSIAVFHRTSVDTWEKNITYPIEGRPSNNFVIGDIVWTDFNLDEYDDLIIEYKDNYIVYIYDTSKQLFLNTPGFIGKRIHLLDSSKVLYCDLYSSRINQTTSTLFKYSGNKMILLSEIKFYPENLYNIDSTTMIKAKLFEIIDSTNRTKLIKSIDFPREGNIQNIGNLEQNYFQFWYKYIKKI